MGAPYHLNADASSSKGKESAAEGAAGSSGSQTPKLCGMPLKYISLITLAIQNALLTIIMHYSRISTAPARTYSAASAVLLNELLKGAISLAVALARIDDAQLGLTTSPSGDSVSRKGTTYMTLRSRWRTALLSLRPQVVLRRFRVLGAEVFSRDCWKLSIPAILYVIQNNLQYVAASNLEAATFQVTYQMKILTTAAFSVMLLRRRLDPLKWFALLALAVGVAIVQLQSTSGPSTEDVVSEHAHAHTLHPIKGLLAVTAACFTSGLAGVYFEMVLKNSQADLWVRNVQLSLFSLLPALVPILFSPHSHTLTPTLNPNWFLKLFENFGPWAWATVITQVLGGLITAVVIKYSDNILKGFATSLSIIISSVASVALFDFQLSCSFMVGSAVVLVATWLYNQPGCARSSSSSGSSAMSSISSKEPVSMTLPPPIASISSSSSDTSSRPSSPRLPRILAESITHIPSLRPSSSRKSSYPGSPVEPDSPLLGQLETEKEKEKKRYSGMSMGNISPGALAAALRFPSSSSLSMSMSMSASASTSRRTSEEHENVLTGRFDPLLRASSSTSRLSWGRAQGQGQGHEYYESLSLPTTANNTVRGQRQHQHQRPRSISPPSSSSTSASVVGFLAQAANVAASVSASPLSMSLSSQSLRSERDRDTEMHAVSVLIGEQQA